MNAQKVSISLPQELLEYTERYMREHGLNSRSAVFVAAVEALRERERIADYQAYRQELEENPDPWLDSDLEETLELSKAEKG